jgi:hypothetical protein
MNLSLTNLAVTLGLGYSALQVYGLAKPDAYTRSLRNFPRSLPWGYGLMFLGTIWFLYNFSLESIADFAAWKDGLYVVFAAVGLGSAIFIRDFLAVRGLAVVLLLLAKLMVDTGRPHLPDTEWVKLFQLWAYVMVAAGIWLTVSPWRLRDWIHWNTGNEKRMKAGCWLRLAFGVTVVLLGIMKFR